MRSAACYKEALHTATEWFPDVLISDIVLPEKDGFQVIKTMRAAYPGLKGIAVSGYASPEDVARSRDAGFSEHFAKPVDIAQLTDAIRHLLVE